MSFDFDSSALIISFLKKIIVHHSWKNIKGGRKNKKPINRIWSKKGLLSNSFLWVIKFFLNQDRKENKSFILEEEMHTGAGSMYQGRQQDTNGYNLIKKGHRRHTLTGGRLFLVE